jgi:hypothetical protein
MARQEVAMKWTETVPGAPALPLVLSIATLSMAGAMGGRIVDAQGRPVSGLYTIVQQNTGRFLDAHAVADRDFAVVTRPRQGNASQRTRNAGIAAPRRSAG